MGKKFRATVCKPALCGPMRIAAVWISDSGRSWMASLHIMKYYWIATMIHNTIK
jgi:hypothetical protein